MTTGLVPASRGDPDILCSATGWQSSAGHGRCRGRQHRAAYRTTGELASRVAALPAVRAALLQKQRDFRQIPGLVTDGRDMGTTVFPDALLKVFLVASPEVRAERRYKQLKEKGFNANLDSILGEIRHRDARDTGRTVSPLKPAGRRLDTGLFRLEHYRGGGDRSRHLQARLAGTQAANR